MTKKLITVLEDIVRAVSILKFDVVRVTGTAGTITVQSRLQDEIAGAVVFSGTLTDKVPEISGVFGLNNIAMLSGILGIKAFSEDAASVTLKYQERNDVKTPEEIVFAEPSYGQASYRLAVGKTIPAQMIQKREVDWDVTVDSVHRDSIARFAQLAGIYATQETKFGIKTAGTELRFFIGDEAAATSKAQVVFASGITGNIQSSHTWNAAGVIAVLKLGNLMGQTTLRIHRQGGMLQIQILTARGEYLYTFAGSN